MKTYRQYPKRSVKVSDLKAYPENPRVPITEDQRFYKDLDGSMDAFGYVVPIVWNERTGHVVSGNQRLQLIKDSGMTEVDVVVVDYDDNTERAAVIALNNIGGRFKKDDLAQLLAKIEGDLKNRVGYSNDELKSLLKKMKQRNKDPDAMPEAPVPVSKKGDLIILGDHRLLCGDSTDSDQRSRLIKGDTPSLIFTDPPYGLDTDLSRSPTRTHRIHGDNPTDALGFYAVMKEYQGIERYICCNWNTYDLLLTAIGTMPDNLIVWVKNNMGMGHRYRHQHEFIAYYGKGTFTNQSDVWNFNKDYSALHPTMKPVELCERAIINSSKEGDIVLDLFGGSGSTLMACERTDRSCYMMELEPHYCDVIIKRWEDYTGEKAVRS